MVAVMVYTPVAPGDRRSSGREEINGNQHQTDQYLRGGVRGYRLASLVEELTVLRILIMGIALF